MEDTKTKFEERFGSYLTEFKKTAKEFTIKTKTHAELALHTLYRYLGDAHIEGWFKGVHKHIVEWLSTVNQNFGKYAHELIDSEAAFLKQAGVEIKDFLDGDTESQKETDQLLDAYMNG